ncbi:MAG: hypothetical protein GY871_04855 [Actinomycetales bacterium]|nr:hypothetical protein [Actinomycetales bacterium]
MTNNEPLLKSVPHVTTDEPVRLSKAEILALTNIKDSKYHNLLKEGRFGEVFQEATTGNPRNVVGFFEVCDVCQELNMPVPTLDDLATHRSGGGVVTQEPAPKPAVEPAPEAKAAEPTKPRKAAAEAPKTTVEDGVPVLTYKDERYVPEGHLEERLGKERGETDRVSAAFFQKTGELEAKDAQVDGLAEALTSLQTEVGRKTEAEERLTDDKDRLTTERDATRKENTELRIVVGTTTSENERLVQERDQTRSDLENERSELQRTREDLSETTGKYNAQKDTIEAVKTARDDAKAQADEYKVSVDELRATVDEYEPNLKRSFRRAQKRTERADSGQLNFVQRMVAREHAGREEREQKTRGESGILLAHAAELAEHGLDQAKTGITDEDLRTFMATGTDN